MYCARIAENTWRKKSPKICHLGTIAQICRTVSSQLRHVSTIRKKLLNSNISFRRLHNMANFGLLTAEIGLPVWGPRQILTGFSSWLHYCSDVAHRRPTKLCTIFGRLLGWYTIYIFGVFCPVTEFCHVQNSLCVLQVLRSRILAALLHDTPAAGVSQTLQCGTRNGITELSQTAPPIFGWAAITLGIGPHSSCIIFLNFRMPVDVTNVIANCECDSNQSFATSFVIVPSPRVVHSSDFVQPLHPSNNVSSYSLRPLISVCPSSSLAMRWEAPVQHEGRDRIVYIPLKS